MSESGYVDAGKLKVSVEADTKGLAAEVRREVEAATRGVTAEVAVEADTKGLSKKLKDAVGKEAEEATKDLAAEQTKLDKALRRVESSLLDVEAAKTKLSRTQQKHTKDSLEYRRAVLAVTLAEDRRTASIRNAEKALKALSDAGGDVAKQAAKLSDLATIEVDADTRPALRKIDELEKKTTGASRRIGSALRAMVVPGIVGLITGAAVAVTGLAGAAGSLAAAMAPAVGTLGLLPGLAATAVASFAPLIIGFQGVGDAMKAIAAGDAEKLVEAMKNLTPAARELVFEIAKLFPALRRVREAVQESLLKETGDLVADLAGVYLPRLTRGLVGIADAWNRAFRNTARFLAQREAANQFTTAIGLTTRAGYELAKTAQPLTRIFLNLWETSTPFVLRMAAAIARVVERFDTFVDRMHDSEALSDFFESSVQTATQLGRILRDLTIGIFNFFSAGVTSGRGMLDTLEQAMARFREFTGSAEGQNKFRKFFEDTRVIAAGLAAAIGFISEKVAELGGLFNRLPDPVKAVAAQVLLIGGAAAFVAAKLAVLAPVFAAIGGAAGAIGAGPILAIAAGVIAIGGAFLYAYQQSQAFRDLVSSAFDTLKQVITSTIATVRPAFEQFGALFSSDIKPALDEAINTLSTRLQPVVEKFGDVFRSDIQPAIASVVDKLKEAQPELQTAAHWVGELVKFFARFSPIPNVLSGIISVVGFLGQVVGTAVGDVINRFRFFVQQIEAIPGRWRAVWGAVSSFFSGVWQNIKDGASTVADFFAALPAKIGAALAAVGRTLLLPFAVAWAGIKHIFDLGISGVIGAIVKMPLNMIALVIRFVSSMISFFSGMWDKILGIWSAGVRAVVEFFIAAPPRLLAIAAAIYGFLLRWVTDLWFGIQSKFAAGVLAVGNFFAALPVRLFVLARAVTAFLVRWVTDLWNGIQSKFNTGVSATGSFFSALPVRLYKIATELKTRLVSFFSGIWASIKKGVVDGVRGIGSAMDGLREAASKPVRVVVNTVINGGILAAYNRVARLFNKGHKDVLVPAFAAGGVANDVVPGYTPGRDVHRFYSPTGGAIDLSGGEPILRPEVGRVVGSDWVYGINAAARRGGTGAVRRFLGGYADGGIVGRHLGGFDGGGFVGWLQDKAKSATEWVVGNFANLVGPIKDKIKGLIGEVPGSGSAFVEAVKAMPRNMVDQLGSWILGAEKKAVQVGTAVSGALRKGMGTVSVNAILAVARRFFPGAMVSSGLRNTADNHGRGIAADLIGGGAAGMRKIAAGFYNMSGALIELIHTPGSYFVKNGKRVGASYYASALADHYDHVHVAATAPALGFDSGGDLPPGTTLVRNDTGKPESVFTQRMLDAIISRLDAIAHVLLSGATARPAGGDVASGFARGLLGGTGVVAGAARTLAAVVPATMNAELGIASPAKVSIAVGRYVADGLVKGLLGSVSQIRAAAIRMTGYLRQALGARANPTIRLLGQQTGQLYALANRRDSVIGRLAIAQKNLTNLLNASAEVRGDIAQKVRESFALVGQGTADTVKSITTRLTKALDAARTFAANITSLKARGLANDLLAQLAAAGPTAGAATATALTKATDAELKQLNTLSSQLATVADKTGVTVADALYAAGIKAAQGLVAGLKTQQKQIENLMLSIAKTMQVAIKRALGIRSPSRVMAAVGRDTMTGLTDGLRSQMGRLHTVVGQVSDALVFTPGLMPAAAGGGSLAAVNVRNAVPIAAAAAAGGGSVVQNIYPRANQSESEIGRIAAREIEWARGSSW